MTAHVDVTRSAPESVLDHSVDHLLIGELYSATHSVDVVGCVRHRLLAARYYYLSIPGFDCLRREHHCLETGAAHLVDRYGRDSCRKTSLQGRLTSRCLTCSALDDVTHDDFVHIIG